MTLLAQVVVDGITNAYDDVDALCNRLSVQQLPELHAKLEEAKGVLFAARVLADEAANGA